MCQLTALSYGSVCTLYSQRLSSPQPMEQHSCLASWTSMCRQLISWSRLINYVSFQKAFQVSDTQVLIVSKKKPVPATRKPRHKNTLTENPVEVADGGEGSCCQARWPGMAWVTSRNLARCSGRSLPGHECGIVHLSVFLLCQDIKIVTYSASP